MVFIERGTTIYAYASDAQQRRAKLFNPPNKVTDPGIDLRRNRALAVTGKSSTPEELKIDFNVLDWAKIKEASKPKVYPKHPLPIGRPSIFEIKRAVSEFYCFPMSTLDSPDRRQEVARARHMVVWLARSQTKKPWGEIARVVPRDHTTLINSFKRIDKLVREGDAVTRQEIRGIWAGLNAYRVYLGSVSTVGQPYLALIMEEPEGLPGPEICLVDEASPIRMVGAKAQGVLDFSWSCEARDHYGAPGQTAARCRQPDEGAAGFSAISASSG